MAFKAGDLVRLKSGGPLMTVEWEGKHSLTGEDVAICIWFEKIGNRENVQRREFPPDILEIAEKPSPDRAKRWYDAEPRADRPALGVVKDKDPSQEPFEK
jgi:uncharacterized protein YodC (DUF2158 family)